MSDRETEGAPPNKRPPSFQIEKKQARLTLRSERLEYERVGRKMGQRSQYEEES